MSPRHFFALRDAKMERWEKGEVNVAKATYVVYFRLPSPLGRCRLANYFVRPLSRLKAPTKVGSEVGTSEVCLNGA